MASLVLSQQVPSGLDLVPLAGALPMGSVRGRKSPDKPGNDKGEAWGPIRFLGIMDAEATDGFKVRSTISGKLPLLVVSECE